MSTSSRPIYQRILLKLSGEALMGQKGFGIDPVVLNRLISEIADIAKLNVQIAIVIGAGNLFRGVALSEIGIDRVTGDQMGMLATLMNALAMRDAFEKVGCQTRIMSSIPVLGMVENFERHKAIRHLDKGRIVIFAGGTGNPLVTTDSAASLRGIEINADILLKATQVDGVYAKDPAKFPDAKMYEHLSYEEALKKELGVMDLNAFCQCRDYGLPIRVFNITKHHALMKILKGEKEGTLVD